MVYIAKTRSYLTVRWAIRYGLKHSPFNPGSDESFLMCRIRTGRPLRVARTSLCRRKLHPSNCRIDVVGLAAIFLVTWITTRGRLAAGTGWLLTFRQHV